MRVAFLGPEGTFAHQRCDSSRCTGDGPIATEPRPTVVSVLEAVEDGQADLGVVPFENSVEGQVNLTVDVLVHDSERIQVCEEVVLDVTFGAYRRPGGADPAATVASHPVGLAQCRRWVHGSGLATRETSSTAEAPPGRRRRRGRPRCRRLTGGRRPVGPRADGGGDRGLPRGPDPLRRGRTRGRRRHRPRPHDVRPHASRRPGGGAAGRARAALGPGPQPLGHRHAAARARLGEYCS